MNANGKKSKKYPQKCAIWQILLYFVNYFTFLRYPHLHTIDNISLFVKYVQNKSTTIAAISPRNRHQTATIGSLRCIHNITGPKIAAPYRPWVAWTRTNWLRPKKIVTMVNLAQKTAFLGFWTNFHGLYLLKYWSKPESKSEKYIYIVFWCRSVPIGAGFAERSQELVYLDTNRLIKIIIFKRFIFLVYLKMIF